MAKLYFYYAAMNAGKSTILLQSSYNYRERGMQTLLFAPTVDTRFGKGKIQSRIGLNQDAINFDPNFQFFDYVQQALNKLSNLACVFVDEAQFLTEAQVKQLCLIVDQLGLPVLTYGLRTDFRGVVFEGSLHLLAWAEELSEVKTICQCGRKATMNMRIDKEGKPVRIGAQIEIGGNERYVSACRRCFHQENIVEFIKAEKVTE